MKVSLNWIKKYIDLPKDLSLESISEKLTFSGLEVEEIASEARGLDKVYIGEIVEKKPHPSAQKLSLTKIALDSSKKDVHSIVCGADNISVGDRVPVAVLGAELPNGMKIKKAKIRGEESSGMLCSPEELDLSIKMDRPGIYLLPKDAPLGEKLITYLAKDDLIMELSPTPNRGDVLSHLGVARELSALFQFPITLPKIELKREKLKTSVHINNDCKEASKAYFACLVEGVKVAPSPGWLRNAIESIGLRSVNNLVDIGNYIMMESGQPVHIFDADTLKEKPNAPEIQLVLRTAKDKEALQTISDKELQLHEEDFLITAGTKGSILGALAGVMGSKNTEVSDSTKNVLIEVAHFSPLYVRKTSHRHKLHSDASYRFSRSIDIANLHWVMDRTAQLVKDLGGGKVGEVAESKGSSESIERKPSKISLEEKDIARLLGKSPPMEEVKKILLGLGFSVEGNTKLLLSPPSWRGDIEIVEDLVEEVARIWGYGHLEPKLPMEFLDFLGHENEYQDEVWHLKEHLASYGFSEAINYAFSSVVEESILGEEDPATVKLMSALGEGYNILKTSLLPGLLRNLSHNLSHRNNRVRLYEMRNCFYKAEANKKLSEDLDTKIKEKTLLSIVFTGAELDQDWQRKEEEPSFYSLKGIVDSLLDLSNKRGLQYKRENIPNYLHPGQAANLFLGPRSIGVLGRLHPKLERKLDIPQAVYVAELDGDFLCQGSVKKYKYRAYSKFPSVDRDFSILVHEKFTARDIENLVKSEANTILNNIEFFDVYKGERVPDSHLSYAFRIRLQSDVHTLTEEELSKVQNNLMSSMREKLQAKFAGE